MKYFIIDVTEHEDYDFTNSPNKKETVRWKLDGTQFIVKYEERFVPEGLGTGYTQTKLLEIINNPENGWVSYDETE